MIIFGMLDKVSKARATMLERNVVPKVLRLTTKDYYELYAELRSVIGLKSVLLMESYLELAIVKDENVSRSRLETYFPYSTTAEGQQEVV